MSFVDSYMPEEVPGWPCVSVPMTKTTITVNAGGYERRNREWEHPLHRFILPEAPARDWTVIEGLLKHWKLMGGPEKSFPWRDPTDFASVALAVPDLEPTITGTDQDLGTGDGFTDTFQLSKLYERDGQEYRRPVALPVVASVIIAEDGVVLDPSNYTVERRGGRVQFNAAPAIGVVLTAGFFFDVEVRFESDDQFETIMRARNVTGFADITLIEVRPC